MLTGSKSSMYRHLTCRDSFLPLPVVALVDTAGYPCYTTHFPTFVPEDEAEGDIAGVGGAVIVDVFGEKMIGSAGVQASHGKKRQLLLMFGVGTAWQPG